MRFVVIGGGCYGAFYATQLLRAADAGAIASADIVIIDHNPQPRVARELSDHRLTVVRDEWDAFFDEYFSSLPSESDDQIVPPPFTPHVALAWLLRALNRAGQPWTVTPFRSWPQTPFVHQSENGTLNTSHADWLCPVHCIEPDICPHTKGARDWDMALTTAAFARSLAATGQAVTQVHVFHCLHYAFGVGTYPASSVVKAFRELSALPAGRDPIRALVATVSRCHGTMHLLHRQAGTDTVSPAVHSGV